MLNTSSLNTFPANTEFGDFTGYDGFPSHILQVSEGTAESGPFSNDGNSVHIAFRFDGEAVTPSVLFGASTHLIQSVSGDAVTPPCGWGNVSHYAQICDGLAYGASSAIGVNSHRLQTSQAAASTGASSVGSASHEVMSTVGVMHTASSINAGTSVHLVQTCRGSALTATAVDEYLDFERDAVIAPTTEAPAFTILHFERL